VVSSLGSEAVALIVHADDGQGFVD
jgi:hypothetical protein